MQPLLQIIFKHKIDDFIFTKLLLNVLEMLGLHFQQVCVSDVRHIQL
jgi:hypothetical protein